MPLSDYHADNDHFEAEGSKRLGFSFPCYVCTHRFGVEDKDPCRTCGHNVNAEAYKREDDNGQ